jgi:hypothetical protein
MNEALEALTHLLRAPAGWAVTEVAEAHVQQLATAAPPVAKQPRPPDGRKTEPEACPADPRAHAQHGSDRFTQPTSQHSPRNAVDLGPSRQKRVEPDAGNSPIAAKTQPGRQLGVRLTFFAAGFVTALVMVVVFVFVSGRWR